MLIPIKFDKEGNYPILARVGYGKSFLKRKKKKKKKKSRRKGPKYFT